MKELVKQHNVITEARYEMSAFEKDLMYVLLTQLRQSDISEHKKVYKIKVKDLQKLTGREIDYGYFSQSVKRLSRKTLYVKKHKHEDEELRLLFSGEYNRNTSAIELELSKDVRHLFLALASHFTQFNAKIALSFSSKYAKRIYEMLSQYKDTGVLILSIEELKRRLYIIDFRTKKDKYPKYGLFRAKVLDAAKKELDEKGDITFDYEARKTGKKITDLVFKITQRHQAQETATPPSPQISELTTRLTKQYKLSPWQAQIVVRQVSTKEIRKTLHEIQVTILDRKVRTVGAYTATVFSKKYNLNLTTSKGNLLLPTTTAEGGSTAKPSPDSAATRRDACVQKLMSLGLKSSLKISNIEKSFSLGELESALSVVFKKIEKKKLPPTGPMTVLRLQEVLKQYVNKPELTPAEVHRKPATSKKDICAEKMMELGIYDSGTFDRVKVHDIWENNSPEEIEKALDTVSEEIQQKEILNPEKGPYSLLRLQELLNPGKKC